MLCYCLKGEQEWSVIEHYEKDNIVYFDKERSRIVAVLLIIFSILETVLMLNLLIAMITSSFESVKDKSKIELNFQRIVNG